MTNLLYFLTRNARRPMLIAALAGVLGGIGSAGLIATINDALAQPGAPSYALAFAFAGLLSVAVTGSVVSEILLARLSARAVFDLRLDMSRRVLALPLQHFEKTGIHRVLVALTEDVQSLSQALPAIPIIGIELAVIGACLAYLAWLSLTVFLAVSVLLLAGVLSYQALAKRATRHLEAARFAEDDLFKHFRGLTFGIKELKLHRARRTAFLIEDLAPSAETARRRGVAGMTLFVVAENWGTLLFFTLLGALLFVLPRFEAIPSGVIPAYVLTAIYLAGPIDTVLHLLPYLVKAAVSLKKVESLGLSWQGHAVETEPLAMANVAPWRRLELVGVTHRYHHEHSDDDFILGPIDLRLDAGELIFLVGGNGSGKSTLAKLITGLYMPETGEIRVDGALVTDAERGAYRERFSAVSGDSYLFERLLGLSGADLAQRADNYLTQFQLAHKTKIEGGRLSTTDLSQGQRKRLALLIAYLEDRPVYVFDEWASDQDPAFKAVFYTQLLPELKRRGKAVLVISHDERYFFVADRVLRMDYGKLI